MHAKLKRHLATLALVGAILSPVPGSALAQPWPNKPIRFIVPFAVGGVTDVVVQ